MDAVNHHPVYAQCVALSLHQLLWNFNFVFHYRQWLLPGGFAFDCTDILPENTLNKVNIIFRYRIIAHKIHSQDSFQIS